MNFQSVSYIQQSSQLSQQEKGKKVSNPESTSNNKGLSPLNYVALRINEEEKKNGYINFCCHELDHSIMIR